MSSSHQRPRPGLLTFIGIVSLIWAATTLAGSILGFVLLLLLGAGGWFLGTVVGAVTTLVATLIALWLLASSLLSILLFTAGWKTLKDDPDGIRLHRLWALISLAMDAVALLGSGGIAPNSWAGAIYAVTVLTITSSPEILSHYGQYLPAGPEKPAFRDDELG